MLVDNTWIKWIWPNNNKLPKITNRHTLIICTSTCWWIKWEMAKNLVKSVFLLKISYFHWVIYLYSAVIIYIALAVGQLHICYGNSSIITITFTIYLMKLGKQERSGNTNNLLFMLSIDQRGLRSLCPAYRDTRFVQFLLPLCRLYVTQKLKAACGSGGRAGWQVTRRLLVRSS